MIFLGTLVALGISEAFMHAGRLSAQPAANLAASDTLSASRSEGEPVLRLAERENPRRIPSSSPEQRRLRTAIDLFLGSVAVFTIYAFLRLRKKPEDHAERVPVRRSPSAAPSAVDAAPFVVEAPPAPLVQDAPGTIDSLRARRESHAQEIDRFLKRI
jgi:hypothetical protein